MSEAVRIADPADPRVDPYRALREADAAMRGQGFIVEGPLALEHALSRGLYPLASVLVSEAKAPRVAALIAAAASRLDLYVAEQAVLDAICGFPVHRGVLAYGRPPATPTAQTLLGEARAGAVVCAIGLNDVENIGAIFRNAAAFGAGAVLLDATCCEPFYRRAIRVSAGAVLSVPSARLAPGEDPVHLLQASGFEPVALTPGGETPLKAYTPPSKTALLVGAEGPGLPAQVLARCRRVRIPMAQGFDSLNVAAATAVALHHILAV